MQEAIRVPCAEGARLDFSWGHGTELQLLEVQEPDSAQGGLEPFVSAVSWNSPSPAHRSLAASVAPLQAELHRALVSEDGRQRGTSSDVLVSFCRAVREQLTKERDSGAEGAGTDTVALEAALWGLLELLCVGASRSEGYITEDLAAWLAEHSPVLDALTPPLNGNNDEASTATLDSEARHCGLSERVGALLESTRPDELPDYWPCMVHLTAVGRMGDALMLLAAHDAMQLGSSAGGGGASASSSSMLAMGASGPGSSAPASVLPQFELLDSLYVVLRQMPRFKRASYAYIPSSSATAAGNPVGGVSSSAGSGPTGREFDNMAEFLAYRATWQRQCASFPQQCADLFESAQASSPHTVQGVLSVLRVLSGSEQDAVAPTQHWLEFAVAQLVHVRPALQVAAHLKGLLQASCAARPFNTNTHVVLALLYDLLYAVSNQDGPQGVVEALSSSGAVSTWFMAHVYELLRAMPLPHTSSSALSTSVRDGSGVPRGGRTGRKALSVLERPLPLSGGDQAEYWRLLLAESLMSSSSNAGTSWGLALSYLAWCPQHGGDAADILMEALPVDGQGGDERLVRKALRACESHGLGPQAAVLSRCVGASEWYAGHVGQAACWFGPGGARDGRRLAVALQPLASAAAAALWSKLGCYEPTPLLQGPVFEELPYLLDALTLSPSPSSPCPLTQAQQHHPVLAALLGLHRLSQAATRLIDVCAVNDSNAAQASDASDTKLLADQWAAARALRDSLMHLLGGQSGGKSSSSSQATGTGTSTMVLPHSLVLPLLAYMVPFMEVAGGGGGLLAGVFSSQDVGLLTRALATPPSLLGPSQALPNGCDQLLQPGGHDTNNGWLAALQGPWQQQQAGHPRHVQDVRLALARFSVRVHAHEVQAVRESGANEMGGVFQGASRRAVPVL